MRREELEVVWHGGLHRDIEPDAEVLAARAAVQAPPVRPFPSRATLFARLVDALGDPWEPPSTIARRLAEEAANISTALHRLAERGSVERDARTRGSRVVYVFRRRQRAPGRCVICARRWAQEQGRCRSCRHADLPREAA